MIEKTYCLLAIPTTRRKQDGYELELNTRKKDEIDYVNQRILKDVSVAPYFNTGSNYRMMWAGTHLISAVKMRYKNVSSRRKRHTEIEEEEILLQVGTTGWALTVDTQEDSQYFAEKLLYCAKGAKHTQLDKWIQRSVR